MKRLPFVLIISGLTAILFWGVFWAAPVQAHGSRHFTLDVAMGDSPSGVNLPDIPMPPDRGIVVLASGNIFPGGTLRRGEDPTFDPNGPGAIGIWRCQFVSLGRDDFPLTGAVTYFFKLDKRGHRSKESMIIVQGLNSHTMNPADFRDSVPRVLAVVGGTGEHAGATGVVREKVIGTNMTSRNLRFRFRLQDDSDDDRSFFSRLKKILDHHDDDDD